MKKYPPQRSTSDVGGILVDNGNSVDIITYELFKRMEFRDDQL
jgi:hypothetical protein